MGLDISVYRIKKEKTNDYLKLIDNDGNYENNFPEWTKEFEQETTEKWYDWEKFKNDTGIDIKECQLMSESYSDDGNFMELWPNKFGKQPDIEDYKIGEDNYDFDAYHAKLDACVIKIDLDKVPLYKKKIKILYIEEIGYQRKGLNNKFYQDYRDGKIGYYVWDKKELQRYKKDYCDKAHEHVWANGEKSGIIDRPKLEFQRNIIDNFIDGECVATFWW